MENLTDIAVFLEVVEAKGFTAAARNLDLSRSVASKAVSRLEARLGVRLLNRTTRRTSLTEAGAALHARAARAMEEIREAELEVARLQAHPRGTLRVTVPMSFGLLHVSPAVPEFLRRHPEVKVDLLMEDRTIDLVAERYDAAIRISRKEDSSLVERRIAPCRMVVCAAPSYVERRGAPVTPEDLGDHDCIGYTYARTPHQWHFTGPGGKSLSVHVRGPYQVNNGLAQREAALAGVGVILVPTFYVGEDLGEERLVRLLPRYETPPLSICAVYPQRRHLPPKVRAFVDFMAERFGDEPYWDRFLDGEGARGASG